MTLLILAYIAGVLTSLALSLLVGGRVYALLKRALGVSQWARRAMGAAVLAGVALIATGFDTGLLSQFSLNGTTNIEQKLVESLAPTQIRPNQTDQAKLNQTGLPVMPVAFDLNAPPDASSSTPAPSPTQPSLTKPSAGQADLDAVSEREQHWFDGAVGWINSPALKSEDLRGKVILVDFWTYSCINCLRTLPYVRAWAEKYKDAGLVVVGVHTPEFAFEKNQDHVRGAVKNLKITYPVAVDSNQAIWRTFQNQYWPALYFVDAQGKLRHHVFGEGQYEESEQWIQKLLAENGHAPAGGLVSIKGTGTQAAPGNEVLSDETYVGYERATNFAPSSGLTTDRPHHYTPAAALKLNQWTLGGDWMVEPERALVTSANARLSYRFHARDLHLVLGRDDKGKPVRFRVLIDGKPPLAGHGTDTDADGNGVIDAYRLYQLVRLPASSSEHLFEIEFLDPGARAYAFTFG